MIEAGKVYSIEDELDEHLRLNLDKVLEDTLYDQAFAQHSVHGEARLTHQMEAQMSNLLAAKLEEFT